MMKIRSGRNLALGLSLALGMSVSAANAAPGDFDADGLSDHSVGLITAASGSSAGSTAWLTRLANGANPLYWSWSVAADALVMGKYYAGDNRYYPGIVYVRSASTPLEWYIKNAAGTDVAVSYGLPGDTVPNQGDFDNDGLTDFVVVRADAQGFLDWYVAYSGSGGGVVSYLFGLSGDKAMVADTNGDGFSEFVLLRGSSYTWYTLNPGHTEYTEVQWGLSGDLPLAPTDLDGDHLADYVVTRKTGTMQVAYIRYGNGQTGTKTLGFDSSLPQVGNFVSTDMKSFAWWQRDTGWNATQNLDDSLNLFNFGISTNALIRADGTIVLASEDGAFPASDNGGGGSSGGGSGSYTCGSIETSGYLWKPASQDSGGTREGYPMVLLSRYGASSGCLLLLTANREAFSCLGEFTSERIYEGYGCGLDAGVPCNGRNSASQLAQQSSALGGTTGGYVYDPGNGRCYTVPNFGSRHDVR